MTKRGKHRLYIYQYSQQPSLKPFTVVASLEFMKYFLYFFLEISERPALCCVCCDRQIIKEFNIEEPLKKLLSATEELSRVLQKTGNDPTEKNGISETKIICWLRGAKQDWLAAENIQKAIDQSETFAKGKEIAGAEWNKTVWECLIRQAIRMQFMRIDFQTFFLKGTSFPRANFLSLCTLSTFTATMLCLPGMYGIPRPFKMSLAVLRIFVFAAD